jgi:hypothetical protein
LVIICRIETRTKKKRKMRKKRDRRRRGRVGVRVWVRSGVDRTNHVEIRFGEFNKNVRWNVRSGVVVLMVLKFIAKDRKYLKETRGLVGRAYTRDRLRYMYSYPGRSNDRKRVNRIDMMMNSVTHRRDRLFRNMNIMYVRGDNGGRKERIQKNKEYLNVGVWRKKAENGLSKLKEKFLKSKSKTLYVEKQKVEGRMKATNHVTNPARRRTLRNYRSLGLVREERRKDTRNKRGSDNPITKIKILIVRTETETKKRSDLESKRTEDRHVTEKRTVEGEKKEIISNRVVYKLRIVLVIYERVNDATQKRVDVMSKMYTRKKVEKIERKKEKKEKKIADRRELKEVKKEAKKKEKERKKEEKKAEKDRRKAAKKEVIEKKKEEEKAEKKEVIEKKTEKESKVTVEKKKKGKKERKAKRDDKEKREPTGKRDDEEKKEKSVKSNDELKKERITKRRKDHKDKEALAEKDRREILDVKTQEIDEKKNRTEEMRVKRTEIYSIQNDMKYESSTEKKDERTQEIIKKRLEISELEKISEKEKKISEKEKKLAEKNAWRTEKVTDEERMKWVKRWHSKRK